MNPAMKALALKYTEKADAVSDKSETAFRYYMNAADRILQTFGRTSQQ